MRKLVLDPDALAVQSFPTTGVGLGPRGTVAGMAGNAGAASDQFTCGDQNTCGGQNTCGDQNTCLDDSCGQSCLSFGDVCPVTVPCKCEGDEDDARR